MDNCIYRMGISLYCYNNRKFPVISFTRLSFFIHLFFHHWSICLYTFFCTDFLSTRKKRIQDFFSRERSKLFYSIKAHFLSVEEGRGSDTFLRAISKSRLPCRDSPTPPMLDPPTHVQVHTYTFISSPTPKLNKGSWVFMAGSDRSTVRQLDSPTVLSATWIWHAWDF